MSAAVYATVNDVILLGRPLTASEQEKATAFLPIASAKLRKVAAKYGGDIDAMIAADEDYTQIVKETVVKAVVRAINASENAVGAPASQSTESALGYSQTYTYINAGQSLYFLKNELKELGLLKQRIGALEVYDIYGDTRDNSGLDG